jgi:hypothetical protein
MCIRACLSIILLVTGLTAAGQAQAPAGGPGTPPVSLTEAVRDLVRSDEGRKGEGMVRWVRHQAERRLRITVRRSRS